jgi:hypothetical protein
LKIRQKKLNKVLNRCGKFVRCKKNEIVNELCGLEFRVEKKYSHLVQSYGLSDVCCVVHFFHQNRFFFWKRRKKTDRRLQTSKRMVRHFGLPTVLLRIFQS